jgi:hypothetical protein
VTGLTDTITATILVGSGPAAVGVDASTDSVYVPNNGSNTVSVIAGGTAASATALHLGPGRVTFGHEQSAVFTATVTPTSPSDPTGTVTVESGAKVLCHITLTSATGHCSIGAAGLAAGSFPTVASYSGDSKFAGSSSTSQALTVARASTKTSLRLSAPNLTYGQEKAEHLSVTVVPKFAGAAPSGNLKVKVSTTTLCTIALHAGTGSCKLAAKALRAGKYRLVASYPGSANFAGSTSAKVTLTVKS